jgi:hypothetical protein
MHVTMAIKNKSRLLNSHQDIADRTASVTVGHHSHSKSADGLHDVYRKQLVIREPNHARHSVLQLKQRMIGMSI